MLLKRQETVDFDPANKAHREAVRAFLKRKAWGDSPIRFTHDPDYGSISDQVQSKLLNWYVDKEAALNAKKSPKAAVPGAKEIATDLLCVRSEYKV